MAATRALPAETVVQLRDLQARSARVNGSTPLDDPRREASVLYAALLAELHADGYGCKTLAKAVGVTRATIQFRLSRHGYRPPTPSQAHNVYRGRMAPHIVDGAGHRRSLGDRCRHGHLLDEANAYVAANGYVRCRRCHARKARERYHRLKAEQAVA